MRDVYFSPNPFRGPVEVDDAVLDFFFQGLRRASNVGSNIRMLLGCFENNVEDCSFGDIAVISPDRIALSSDSRRLS